MQVEVNKTVDIKQIILDVYDDRSHLVCFPLSFFFIKIAVCPGFDKYRQLFFQWHSFITNAKASLGFEATNILIIKPHH